MTELVTMQTLNPKITPDIFLEANLTKGVVRATGLMKGLEKILHEEG